MEGKALFFIVQDDDGIRGDSIRVVEKELGKERGDTLYLVIESFGGDPFSAVGIMNILHSRFKRIVSIIPSHAKSAGTLMAIGTDEICMTDKSSIGPLDLPIEHPKDGSRISALDVQQTITNLATLSESIADERYKFLRRDIKVSKKDAASLALECGTEFVRPIVSQIDPYHLQKANRQLRIGFFYALDMLLSRMMKDTTGQAEKTARSLVHDWPTHEYSIFKNDAKNILKLAIRDLDSLPEWNEFLEKEYNKYAGKPNVIKYCSFEISKDAKIIKNAKK